MAGKQLAQRDILLQVGKRFVFSNETDDFIEIAFFLTTIQNNNQLNTNELRQIMIFSPSFFI